MKRARLSGRYDFASQCRKIMRLLLLPERDSDPHFRMQRYGVQAGISEGMRSTSNVPKMFDSPPMARRRAMPRRASLRFPRYRERERWMDATAARKGRGD